MVAREFAVSDVVPLEAEVASLIVQSLNLKIEPAAIKPLEPLFREGLGLDSIDALELSLAISKSYGFQLRSDDPDIAQIFSSLRELCKAIDKNRTK
jgi:acyl carrier protein